MGMATARDIKGEDNSVVAIIGDGALTGGMALEALNHIGHEQKDLDIVGVICILQSKMKVQDYRLLCLLGTIDT